MECKVSRDSMECRVSMESWIHGIQDSMEPNGSMVSRSSRESRETIESRGSMEYPEIQWNPGIP